MQVVLLLTSRNAMMVELKAGCTKRVYLHCQIMGRTNKYWGNWIIYTLSHINQLLRHTYLFFIFCIYIWIRKRNHLLLSPFCYRTSGYIKWIFLCLPYYLILHCRWSCLRGCCRSMGCRRATECSSTCQWSPRPSSRCWHVPAWGRYTRSSLEGSRRRNCLPGSITQRWVTIHGLAQTSSYYIKVYCHYL